MKKLMILPFLFLTSCALLQGKIQKPEVQLKKVDVKDMTMNDANFVFNFSIKNPNKVALDINQVVYNLELNGKPFTQGVFEENIKLAPETASHVNLPVRVKYNDLMQSLTDYLQDRTVQYRLNGSVELGAISVPFNDKGEVELDSK